MPRLRERLSELAARGCPLVAGLDQVSLSDPAGIAALAGTARRAAGRGGGLHAGCNQEKICELFRLTGRDCRMPLARSLAEVMQALAAARTVPG